MSRHYLGLAHSEDRFFLRDLIQTIESGELATTKGRRDAARHFRRKALGHRDHALATKEARRLAAALEQGRTATHNPSVGYVLGLYRHYEVPRHKAGTRRWLLPALEGWENYVGAGFPCQELGPRE